MTLTGRLDASPIALIHEEFLEPQFRHEARNLLPWYVLIEKALLIEYERLGVLSPADVVAIATRLDTVDADTLVADPSANLSDISLAIERCVTDGLHATVPAWHIDRSRNDLQACAQLLYGRTQVLEIADLLGTFASTTRARAAEDVTSPMPGYTQLQAAQVITPGFYLAALTEHALDTSARLLTTYDRMNRSPLGAGPMAGQELAWDRDSLAHAVGCTAPVPHALAAVASRSWLLDVAGDLSTAGVGWSRFLTDLLAWSSGAYGLLDLPDALAGISAAMPQKKNYPVLERLRGRSGHLTAFYLDFATGQRNTPYSSMVEVSKEAGTHAPTMFANAKTVLLVFTLVIRQLRWRTDVMRAMCEAHHLGGFSIANDLVRRAGVPWRLAQVIVGRYVAATLAGTDGPAALAAAAADAGHPLADAASFVDGARDPDSQLAAKVSTGSTRPQRVRELLAAQHDRLRFLHREWRSRRDAVDDAVRRTTFAVRHSDRTSDDA
jgi:argininosuccinate lyase